jgi:hypothetical protein
LSEQRPLEAGDAARMDPGRNPAGEEPGALPAAKRSWRLWVLIFGVFVIPGVLYLALLVLPFLPLTPGQKLWVASGLVVGAEGTFLLSVLILGREVVRGYRRFFEPRSCFGKKAR